ncbi:MFS transporter [uncultured Pseudokineococcus sp.]|uniref:MFS transporter n=1 Tax=uncultured Pseudokineococcus sp. TaxID=1642928 RepID=UPI00262A67CB|nr:MFS transporter [uncultured Pseudokineococcus sp.]
MTTTAPPTRAAYRDLNVLRWTTGLFLSLLGDQVFFIALAWTATQVATPSVAGLVVAAGAVPRAALMLFGGALADRAGPRRTALLSDAARTAVMLVVAAVLLLEPPSAAVLIALAVAFGTIDAVFIPAVGAMPAALVEPTELSRVTAMRQAVHRATTIAGAPLAGWLIAASSLSVVYLVCAGLFAVSVAALAATRTRPPAPPPPPAPTSAPASGAAPADAGTDQPPTAGGAPDQAPPATRSPARGLLVDVTAGLRYVRGHTLLLPLLVLTAVAELGFVGAVNVGLPLLADASGWGPQGVGWVLGAWGAAAALASVVLTLTGSPQRAGLVGIACLPLMGVSLAAIALAPSLSTAAAAAALLGLGSGIISPVFGGLALAAADAHQVGRVMSVLSLASFGGAPLAHAATGVLVDLTDATAPFLLGGAVVTVTGLVAFAVRPVRTARPDGSTA